LADIRPSLDNKSVKCHIYGMVTTLRLNEAIFREAKAEAARSGVTLTRFIEDALRQRLGRKSAIAALPFFDSGVRLPKELDLETLVKAEEDAYAMRVAEKLPLPLKPQ
jgi:hypothetical protein